MRYLKLSSDSDKFSKLTYPAKPTDPIVLSWFSTLDLTQVKTLGLTNIQIAPLSEKQADYYLIIYSNLLKCTECNPKGELSCVRIPKKHTTIPTQINLGKQP